VAASLPLLLAVTASGGVVPAQAASITGVLFAGHDAPGRGTAPAPACARRTGTGWKQVPTVDPGNFDELTSVAVLSSCQAWAVGNYSGGTLIESWDGTAWTQQPSPSPGSAGNGLFGVAATSVTDAWAVGDYSGVGDPTQSQILIEHWNGTAWKQVPSPNPTSNDALSSVVATSPTNAWAVGEYVAGAAVHALIEHWNGTAWKQVPSPSPGGTNGSVLSGVDATSLTSAWAVGDYSSSGSVGKTLIEHWNGTAWKQVPSPEPANGSVLSGVDATSPTSAWAVGSSPNGGGKTLILHWNGTAWNQVPSPSPGGTSGSALSGVDATSAAAAWAVGSYSNTDKTLILHWDGTTWSKVASPNPSLLANQLSGVAATSPANIWAVGIHSNLSTFLTLAVHCC
jgi:hypothetical protein